MARTQWQPSWKVPGLSVSQARPLFRSPKRAGKKKIGPNRERSSILRVFTEKPQDGEHVRGGIGIRPTKQKSIQQPSIQKGARASMGKNPKKTTTLDLKKINIKFFVRHHLHEDRVQYFMDMYKSRGKVAPIQVTEKSFILVDGRHRLEALKRLGRKSFEVELVPNKKEVELIVDAYRANSTDGPLPPTTDDTQHTFELLMRRGYSRNRIADEFGKFMMLPRPVIMRYLSDVQSRINKVNIANAATAVRDGKFTAPDAAIKFKVALPSLKTALGAKKSDVSKSNTAEVKGGLSTNARKYNSRIAQLYIRLMKDLKDGAVTEKHVLAIMAHIKHLLDRQRKTFNDTEKRFNTAIAELKKG